MTETTALIEEDRYKRQTAIWGQEGQKKLAQARVAIVGLGPQGVYNALCLLALGVGNIVLIDGNATKENELFLDLPVPAGSRAAVYPSLLSRVNPQVRIEGYTTNLESRVDQLALWGSTVIIDATNSVKSKELALAYSRENNIPMFSAASKWGYGKMLFCAPGQDHPEQLLPQFEGQTQDALMALSLCGVTIEEVKKVILGSKNEVISEPVRYRLGNGYRFGFLPLNEEVPRPDQDLYRSLKVAFLGAGALGNWAAIAASFLKLGRLDIFDYDHFESHNINRQVLAYDGIGKEKATHLAQKVIAMSRDETQSTGYNVLIGPGFNTATEYQAVFDFVDNKYTRAINCAYAVSHGLPFISAGAMPSGARWDVHVPGQTQCLNCLYDIYEEGRKEEMIRRASCAHHPDPSVVMSNAIAGVNAVLELLTVFEPEKFGRPFNGEQTYRTNGAKRYGTSPLKDACDCHTKPVPNLEVSQAQIDEFVQRNQHLLEVQP